jgi:endonuclease-3 related protein
MPRPTLRAFHRRLHRHYGPLGWWPGDTDFEVVVGAVLTQNTAWSNVEKAIANLKRAGVLDLRSIQRLRTRRLAALIRPAGYFNVKARRLHNLVRAIAADWDADLERMFAASTEALRSWLLGVNGVGKETADSILCYAGEHPVFVVDAYTRRILSRHGLVPPEIDYDALQEYCIRHLPRDVALYNQFHAEIVYLGKDYCRKRPHCQGCPLEAFL